MADENITNLRASMQTDDLRSDRRMIMKKIQQRRRAQSIKEKAGKNKSDDASGAKDSTASHPGSVIEEESFGGLEEQYSIDEDLFHDVQAAHQEDEQMLGGRIEDGGEEGLDAMNQALTSPPTAWWAMRKQWQKRRGSMMNMVPGLGGGAPSAGAPSMGGDEEMDGIDASNRSSASRPRLGGTTFQEAGVVGHPMMLEDPSSIGYDAKSYRQNPYASMDKRKRTPTVLYVSKDVIQKRKMQQTMYILAAVCVVFLFMFVLEQRKLSHYAMIESPMSLEAYLAGEELMANSDSKVTLGDLGLEDFEGVNGRVPEVEFGNIEVNPNDPLANPELANDPLVGNEHEVPPELDFGQIQGTERFNPLKQVVVGWGVTPAEVFENESSAQYRALHWMAHEDPLRYTPDNDHWIKKIVQRYALATIYYATNGPGWTDTLYFLSEKDECSWNRKDFTGYFTGAGHCDGGYITALALWSNNLDGALPPEIGSLESLRTISVFDNLIRVAPPKSIVKLRQLNRLYLQKNEFKGDINYLCPPFANDFVADCGKKGGVLCDCCSKCGYNRKNARSSMVDKFNTK